MKREAEDTYRLHGSRSRSPPWLAGIEKNLRDPSRLVVGLGAVAALGVVVPMVDVRAGGVEAA